MAQAQALQPVTEDAYLRAEDSAVHRHEYVAGGVHAMAGASERHNRIAGNIFFHLRAATRGRACRAFMADMKLRLDEGALYYYPDAMLVCDPADDHPTYKRAPCLVAEVLAPATAAIDLREKWSAYRRLPSLRYYLLVDAERLWARAGWRNADGGWLERELGRDDALDIACDGTRLRLSLDDLYEDSGLL